MWIVETILHTDEETVIEQAEIKCERKREITILYITLWLCTHLHNVIHDSYSHSNKEEIIQFNNLAKQSGGGGNMEMFYRKNRDNFQSRTLSLSKAFVINHSS